MSLKFAKIQKVYPNWGEEEPSSSKLIINKKDIPPSYSNLDYEEFQILKNLKEYQKLRNINGKLVIENRIFSSIRRKISGDSRLQLLIDLNKFNHCNKYEILILNNVIEILSKSTYKKDTKWCLLANELIKM